MTTTLAIRIVAGIFMLGLVLWLRKRVTTRLTAATATFWSWEALIHTALWDIMIFGFVGIMMSYQMLTGADINVSVPDPAAPVRSAMNRSK